MLLCRVQISAGGLHVVRFSWKEALQLVVRNLVEKTWNGERPTSYLWCLCENLINALKLLANQQSDGEGPIQSIVAGLGERSRKHNYGRAEKLYQS